MLTLQMLVKNEAELLVPLLELVASHVEEIVVVDTGSEDASVELARRYTDKVYSYPLNHDFAAARNYGLSQGTQPYQWVLDADECPNGALLTWLDKRDFSAPAYALLRHNLIGGADGPVPWEWHVRLFQRGLRYVGVLHEQVRVPYITNAPEDCILLHSKSWERQNRQNALYTEWSKP